MRIVRDDWCIAASKKHADRLLFTQVDSFRISTALNCTISVLGLRMPTTQQDASLIHKRYSVIL